MLPAVALRSADRRSQDGRCAHGSCGGLEAEAESSHSLTPRLQVFPHQAAADDPLRSCEAWCTDERRHRRAGAPSRPRRHPCSRHGGAAASTAAATTRAGGGVLPSGEVGARLQLQLGESRVAREGGVGSSAARQVGAEHPDLLWREGRGVARSPVLCFRATPARARRPSSRATPAFALVLPGVLLQTARLRPPPPPPLPLKLGSVIRWEEGGPSFSFFSPGKERRRASRLLTPSSLCSAPPSLLSPGRSFT